MEIRRPNAGDTVDVWVGLTADEVEQMEPINPVYSEILREIVNRAKEVVNL